MGTRFKRATGLPSLLALAVWCKLQLRALDLTRMKRHPVKPCLPHNVMAVFLSYMHPVSFQTAQNPSQQQSKFITSLKPPILILISRHDWSAVWIWERSQGLTSLSSSHFSLLTQLFLSLFTWTAECNTSRKDCLHHYPHTEIILCLLPVCDGRLFTLPVPSFGKTVNTLDFLSSWRTCLTNQLFSCTTATRAN